MSQAPESIYLDGDVEAGDGMFPRCFEDPKYASEPPVEYVRADRIEELEAKLAKAVEALERIAHASDFYSVEANAEDQGADTLAYAHKSTCNIARTTLAELKGEQKDG